MSDQVTVCGGGGMVTKDRAIDDGAIEGRYPLAPLQEGLLFAELLAQDESGYRYQVEWDFEGELRLPDYHRAVEDAVKENAILRAAFEWDSRERPMQVIHRDVLVPFETTDLRSVRAEEQRAGIREYMIEDASGTFDLTRPPLMRLRVFLLGARRWKVVGSFHQILLDDRSVLLFADEVLRRYDASLAGRRSELTARRPYWDYIDWLTRQDLRRAERYWRELLAGFDHPTPLPAERTGERGQAVVVRTLDNPALVALKRLGLQARVPLSTVILGAWAVTLARHSESDDVVFGTMQSRRPHELPGADRMLGQFASVLPVRMRYQPWRRVGEWLRDLQSQLIESGKHCYAPLATMQEWSRVGAGQRLFESVAVVEDASMWGELLHRAADPKVVSVDCHKTTDYQLALRAVVDERALRLGLAYRRGQLTEPAADRLLWRMEIALRQLAAGVAQELGEVSLFGDGEYGRVMAEWNRTEAEYPAGATMAQLFEQQAERSPQAVALIDGERELTYAELNRRANRLAHRLIELGVGRERLVGISAERSAELVVGFLAIWKAGGAYLALDPSYPPDRLQFMLDDSGAQLLLVAPELTGRFTPKTELVVLTETWQDYPSSNPEPRAKSANLAYVIYTSGTTGQPKGALIEHRGLANLFTWYARVYGPGPGDRVSWFSSISFDATFWEVFPALCAGAMVIIGPSAVTEAKGSLIQWLMHNRVTVAFLVTPLFESLELRPEDELELRWLQVAGDRLWRHPDSGLHLRFANNYGPTETTVCATYCELARPEASDIPPIGKPIDNCKAYVLDQWQKPVPVGVPGELYIGGVGVGRGYLNRPDQTRLKFIDNPFGTGKLYRTGDLVRWRDDGNLDFLGRRDSELKIRGFRIALQEIEACLLAQAEVKDAGVADKGPEHGQKWLVGYVVRHAGSELDFAEMRTRLARWLPGYMIPHAWVELESLPRSPNGKIDRSALPDPSAAERGYESPRDDIETDLCRIWAEVLGQDRVGIHDNFFDLGGDSIKSIRIVSRACAADLALRPGDVLTYPTVAELATAAVRARTAHLRIQRDVLGAANLRQLIASAGPAEETEDIYPLTPLQEGLLYHSLGTELDRPYHQQLILTLEGHLDVQAYCRGWHEALRANPVLRTGFAWRGFERPLQVVRRHAALPVRQEDWRNVDEARQERLLDAYLRQDLERGFDLERPPLLRIALFREADERWQVVCSFHHILMDGWSMASLRQELDERYAASVAGRRPRLAERRPYGDYVEWLRRQSLDRAEEYWRGLLTGFDERTPLPVEPSDAAGCGQAWRVLDPARTSALTTIAGRQRLTVGTLIHAAWGLLLCRYANSEDVVFGSTSSGRPGELTGAESMLGLLINTLPVRLRVSADAELGAWLRDLQRQLLESREYEYTPLMLVQGWSDVGGRELFDSIVVYENFPAEQPAHAQGLPRVVSADLRGASSYPLNLAVYPGEQLKLGLGYRRSGFSERRADRLLEQLERILLALPEGIGRSVADLPLLDPAEFRQVVVEWNRTEAAFPRSQTIPELVDEQAERTPDKVAVVAGQERLTYSHVCARANQMAARLSDMGAGPGSAVGICTERAADMVAGMLGILKTGSAYVPLHHRDPAERLAFLLAESDARLILTQQSLADSLGRLGKDLVLIDGAAPVAAAPTGQQDRPAPAPDDLAYILYTSGSTGRPKGVQVRHRNVVNLITAMRSVPGLCAEDVVLGVATYAFDMSVGDIFPTLANGARLVLASYDDARDPRALARLIGSSGATIMHATPATWQMLVDSGWEGSKRLVGVSGGEALSGSLADALIDRCAAVWNGYGPTETTVYATFSRVSRGTPITIGRPIANVRVYVLDQRQRPAPVGAPGEIVIGGAGVTAGYINRQDETCRRFIPDPFASGAMVYRTGDLGRFLPDGSIQHLGRLDRQVKVRGMRIEPGEIEAVLREQPGVKEAVVVVREDRPGNKQLVGYVVRKDGCQEDVAELRERLRERLPLYMVPASCVDVPALPLTANGKLDWRSLPTPEYSDAMATAPRNRTEAELCEMFAEVLRVARVGIDDEFFAIGGDSIQAVVLIDRIERQYGYQIKAAELLDNPTVASLAKLLIAAGRASGVSHLDRT